jgi:hypothetical protein
MKRILTTLLLTLCFSSLSFAQEDDAAAKTLKALTEAARNGNGLKTTITVNGNVHAQAVLIPREDAKRIFGTNIANNYAVIEVNVGNKSPDAALIIHGIFVDYSRWPLSGSTPSELNASLSTDSYQASSFPNQVASAEYRIVRGQLLDAQTDTWRNRIMRYLTLAGSLAGAFTFSLNEKGIIQGIASANGVGIPGVATAWPDKTIDQLNRVSDFGFRANKVIPKQGSDVIVCFFPIDRFLTPGFRKLFLKSPALFFAPLQMLVDKQVKQQVDSVLGDLFAEFGFDATALRRAFPCYMAVRHGGRTDLAFEHCLNELGLDYKRDKKTQEILTPRALEVVNREKFRLFMGLEFIGGVSLNRVTVTVDGVMSVDVTTTAGRIEDAEFDRVANCGDDSSPCFWANVGIANGTRTGTIKGAYLTGSTVKLAEAEALGITVKTLAEGSNDQGLRFSLTLTKLVPPQTKLHFSVTKPQQGAGENASLDSLPFQYLVDYSPTAPLIQSLKREDGKLTLKGNSFNGPDLKVILRAPDGNDIEVAADSVTVNSDGTELSFTLPDAVKAAGCWRVQVSVKMSGSDVSSNQSDEFLITPKPTLDSAVRDVEAKIIILTGDDLIDTTRCGGPALTFQIQKEGGTAKPLTLASPLPQAAGARQARVKLPSEAKEGAGWTVRVLLDGKEIASTELK